MSIAAISLQTLEGVGVSLCKVFKRPLLHITVTSIFLFVVVMRVRVIISFSGKCTLLKWSFYSYQKKKLAAPSPGKPPLTVQNWEQRRVLFVETGASGTIYLGKQNFF